MTPGTKQYQTSATLGFLSTGMCRPRVATYGHFHISDGADVDFPSSWNICQTAFHDAKQTYSSCTWQSFEHGIKHRLQDKGSLCWTTSSQQ